MYDGEDYRFSILRIVIGDISIESRAGNSISGASSKP